MVLTEKQQGTTMSNEIRGLTEIELDEVSGGNFWLGVLAGVLGNAITKAIESDGPVKGGILDYVLTNVVPK
jgi:hypothetical protein